MFSWHVKTCYDLGSTDVSACLYDLGSTDVLEIAAKNCPFFYDLHFCGIVAIKQMFSLFRLFRTKKDRFLFLELNKSTVPKNVRFQLVVLNWFSVSKNDSNTIILDSNTIQNDSNTITENIDTIILNSNTITIAILFKMIVILLYLIVILLYLIVILL